MCIKNSESKIFLLPDRKYSENLNDNEYNMIMPLTLDDKFANFLESLKPIMQNGNDSLEIPVLDPFETEFEEIEVNETNMR